MIIKQLIFNILAPLAALGLTLFVLPFVVFAIGAVVSIVHWAAMGYMSWLIEVMKYLGV